MVNKLVAGAVMVAMVAMFLGTGGLAVFTDSADVTANTFDSGDIEITTSPTSAVVTFADMIPGDTTGQQPLTVNNIGTDELRYAISSVADNSDGLGLKDALTLTISEDGATADECTTDVGAQLYSGDLDSTAGLLVGDASQGADAGDRVLASGNSETLCFEVSFALSATGPENAATTVTFTFDAEQTGNNP